MNNKIDEVEEIKKQRQSYIQSPSKSTRTSARTSFLSPKNKGVLSPKTRLSEYKDGGIAEEGKENGENKDNNEVKQEPVKLVIKPIYISPKMCTLKFIKQNRAASRFEALYHGYISRKTYKTRGEIKRQNIRHEKKLKRMKSIIKIQNIFRMYKAKKQLWLMKAIIRCKKIWNWYKEAKEKKVFRAEKKRIQCAVKIQRLWKMRMGNVVKIAIMKRDMELGEKLLPFQSLVRSYLAKKRVNEMRNKKRLEYEDKTRGEKLYLLVRRRYRDNLLCESMKCQKDIQNLDKRDLQGLYKRLCNPNTLLEQNKLIQFCSDCPRFIDTRVTMNFLINIFNEIKDENKIGLSYAQWIMFLCEIGGIKYPKVTSLRGIKSTKESQLIQLLDVYIYYYYLF